MREKYRKPANEFKANLTNEIVDLSTEEWNRLEKFEKKLRRILVEYKAILKKHSVYQMPPEVKDLRGQLSKQLKEDTANLKRFKWYHRNKTKWRNYYKKRMEKSIKMINYIDSIVAKAKKKFDEKLKQDPNYFKKRYEYAVEVVKEQIRKVGLLKKRVIISSKREEKIIIHMYKRLLHDLQHLPSNPDKYNH